MGRSLSTQRGHGALGWHLEDRTSPGRNFWEQDSASSRQSPGVRGSLDFTTPKLWPGALLAIPGRNKLQNINLCCCRILEGALTLECAHQGFKELVTRLSAGEGAGSHLSGAQSCPPAQEEPISLHEFHRSVVICNKIGQTALLWSKGCVLFFICHDILWCITASWVLFVVISLKSPFRWLLWTHYAPAYYQIRRIPESLFLLYLCQDKFLQLINFHLLL